MKMPILRQIPVQAQGEGLFARLRAMYARPVMYELVADYRCRVTIAGTRRVLLLPRGFRSDLASTPRISWALGFRPDAPALLLPGLWHDYYYRHGYYLGFDRQGRRVHLYRGRGRAFADREFSAQVFRQSGLYFPALVVRIALGLFGWIAWNAHRKQDKKNG